MLNEHEGNLFVTGRAGTGKSTLLRTLRDMITVPNVVVAPTGLAAVTAGGQTIHSFFGFPPKLIQPSDIRRSRNGGIMRRLQMLIIDEVSMVRSDLMNAIDLSLRLNRGRPRDPSIDTGLDHMYRALSLAVFVFDMLGDALRDLLDPRLKGG